MQRVQGAGHPEMVRVAEMVRTIALGIPTRHGVYCASLFTSPVPAPRSSLLSAIPSLQTPSKPGLQMQAMYAER
jgi:hypothetical protein